MYALAVEKLAENTPENTRASSNSGKVCATAMSRKSTPSPKQDSRMTSRRPYRSDKAPWIGEQKNWIAANRNPNQPIQCAASA